jgi:hypothetical protein
MGHRKIGPSYWIGRVAPFINIKTPISHWSWSFTDLRTDLYLFSLEFKSIYKYKKSPLLFK